MPSAVAAAQRPFTKCRGHIAPLLLGYHKLSLVVCSLFIVPCQLSLAFARQTTCMCPVTLWTISDIRWWRSRFNKSIVRLHGADIADSASTSIFSRRALFVVVNVGDGGESRRNHEIADGGRLVFGVWMWPRGCWWLKTTWRMYILFCIGVSGLWGELIVLCTGSDDGLVHVSMELEFTPFTGPPPVIAVSPVLCLALSGCCVGTSGATTVAVFAFTLISFGVLFSAE